MSYVLNSSIVERAGLGLIPRWSVKKIFGRNPSVNTANVPVDLWPTPGGVLIYPDLDVAQSLEALSSSAADAPAGTGAYVVLISGGLDNTLTQFSPVTEVVLLNGTTPVALTRQYRWLDAVAILPPLGSGQTNAGDITVRIAGGGTAVAQIRAGDGISKSGIYIVPAGYEAWLLEAKVGVHRALADGIDLDFCARDSTAAGAWWHFPGAQPFSTGSTFIVSPEAGLDRLPAGLACKFQCMASTGNSLVVSSQMTFLLHQL